MYTLHMTSIYILLWWAEPVWLSGAHQAALSLSLLSATGGENKTENSWVEIKAD